MTITSLLIFNDQNCLYILSNGFREDDKGLKTKLHNLSVPFLNSAFRFNHIIYDS